LIRETARPGNPECVESFSVEQTAKKRMSNVEQGMLNVEVFIAQAIALLHSNRKAAFWD
jgi:hypothetical protein